MTERRVLPIIFTGPMVPKVLDGSKTQTRRVVRWPFPGDPGPERLDNLGDNETVVATDFKGKQHYVRCPYGDVDDLLFVRETTARSEHGFLYRADGDRNIRWTPSIHMPRVASRQTLRVTDHPEVERLLAISEDDARAEGFADRAAFFAFFKTLNPKTGSGNPWVWKVSFARA